MKRRCVSCRPRRCALSRGMELLPSYGALFLVGQNMELHPLSGALSPVKGVSLLPVMMARRRSGAVSRNTELAPPSGALSPVEGVPPLPVMIARRHSDAVSRDTELPPPSIALSPVEGKLPPTAQHCAPWRRRCERVRRVR